MSHSVDKMHFAIQKALLSLSESVPAQARENAYIRVVQLSAEELASLVHLPEDSVWILYYCRNWTVEHIVRKQSLREYEFKFMLKADVYSIARALIEGETEL